MPSSNASGDAGNAAAGAAEIRNLIDQAASLPRADADAASALLRRAIDVALASNMQPLEALARHELGCRLRRTLTAREEALGELNRALDLRIQLADVRGQIDSLLELGTDAMQHSDLGNALPHLHEAERLCRRSGNLEALADTCETLGGVYAAAGQYEKALEYSRLGLDVARQLGDARRLSHALDAVACSESDLDRHDDAQRHFQESLSEAEGIEDPQTREYGEGMIYVDLARAMCRARRWQEAKHAADQAIGIVGTRDWAGIKAQAISCKTLAMVALGEAENVERSLHEAYLLFQTTGNKNELSKMERELSRFYQGVGDYRRAFEFLEHAMATELAMRRDAVMHQMAQQSAREKLDQLTEKSAQLEIASKHKTEFLANMSHELRTPLNAIIGFSEVLLERMFGEMNAKQEDYLKDIHSSGKHLLSLINDILDLSKIEAGRMELELADFELRPALENAIALIKERAQRHGIRLALEIDPGLGQIRADERKFKQVMLNLLSNAVKFTPEGGSVSVCAKPSGTMMVVAVSDTGPGIAPADQAAVFEEFRQVGPASAGKAEGTGLGLPLTKKFIELHGGGIRLESAPGEGLSFIFTVPIRPGG